MPSENSQNPGSVLGNTVKTVFGHCAGMVDVASVVLESCHGNSDDPAKAKSLFFSGFNEKMGLGKPRSLSKKQCETLEFPSEQDDDVSALSARTLEEMERLHRQRPVVSKPGQPQPGELKRDYDRGPMATLPKAAVRNDWRISAIQDGGCDDVSIGVSTSGSASTSGFGECTNEATPIDRIRNAGRDKR